MKVWASVDGTDCPILEPRPFSRNWYSHKFRCAGVRYEIAVSIANGNIVWCNGPYQCGAFNDLSIFRDELKQFLDDGELLIADNGYKDERCILPEDCGPENLLFHKAVRARHECVNGRLKTFSILRYKFRHDVSLHKYCFHAIANIVKLSFDESPNFEITI